MTHKERMLCAIRGMMPDMIPYAPRIDLWYNANSFTGAIPEKHKGCSQDEISRKEGWGLHKVIPEYRKVRKPEHSFNAALGLFSLKETVYDYRLSSNIEVKAVQHGDITKVEYHTPIGKIQTRTIYTEDMKKAGVSSVWIQEHPIKRQSDYKVLGYIFENIEIIAKFDDFAIWQNKVGEDGLAVTLGMRAASPIHHIQKHFIDATAFYYHYNDYQKEMRILEQKLKTYFDQVLDIISDSPAEAVLWGINFDEMITYPDYFRKDILPWIRKVSEVLSAKGKALFCHCDGENLSLLELFKDSGMHVAEGICPYPMTKIKIDEYYRQWSDKLTIFGGIPSTMLLKEATTEKEFETYLDYLFKAVAPGKRFILGIGDTVPANAIFDRLVRIGERVEKEGLLPLKAGAIRPLSKSQLIKAKAQITRKLDQEKVFKRIQDDIFMGDHIKIVKHVQEKIDDGANAEEIIKQGMIAAMEVIGEKFRNGKVFIPEVLMSARAMNEALLVLEPYLSSENKAERGKVLIATVKGDLHDIGKNMVITTLRGVGFETLDMGINVPTEKIVEQVSEYKPDILGLSALLTTTMNEMGKVIAALKESGLREKVKVMVGGAPLSAKFAEGIGADGYADDAGEAVNLVKKLLSI
jgi:corrinoid protein of di/trimethylamine methyltransferase